jgi:3-hydroxyisobutyrate dehydrogenase-like beta-hydroxyacid dehydrogenase
MKIKVGVAGLGLMGSAIAANLLSQGNEVHVYNRTLEKAQPLQQKGALVHKTPKELASAVDILITSLTDEQAVQQVALGDQGFLEALKEDAVWLEMSTIDPDASVAFASQAKKLKKNRLEVPIVGNPDMERQRKVILLVGGDRELFEKTEAVIQQLGNPVLYIGSVGAGLRMKLAVNLYLGLNAETFSEAYVFSRKLGFGPDAFVDVINQTAHRNDVSEVKGPKIAAHDFATSFSMNNLFKDLRFAKAQADRAKVVLPVTELVFEQFSKAVAAGDGKLDYCVIARQIERLNGLSDQ